MEIDYKGKRVLVTGGTGFVGSHLVKRLLGLGAYVVTTMQRQDLQSYFYQESLHTKAVCEQVDIACFDRVFSLIAKHNVELIFHLAAQPLVEVAYNDPRGTFASNIQGTIHILESARLLSHVRGVILASSDKAYGKLSEGKYFESDALRGDHPYEVSKSAADLIAYSYYKTYGVPVVTTRFGNIYGEGDLNFSRIIPGIMHSFVTGKTLVLRSDGSHIRDYLYVADVVDGYVTIASHLNSCIGEAYNFGSNDTMSVNELIDLAKKVLNRPLKTIVENVAKNEIPYQSLNYDKINSLLGWKPKHTLQSTLLAILSWYKSHIV